MDHSVATVRLFGALHTLQKERGGETMFEVELPPGGVTGAELATMLDLPLSMIEGVFCNRTVRPIGYRLMPGDRIAFVPEGTPGPHRFFLGLYAAGKEGAEADESAS
ncbi:MAG: MoaD/ThiS family protein [Coriobacteriia bacterium]|nr:MoaD/ThiS family protein [Coriobacteriia bacterium]